MESFTPLASTVGGLLIGLSSVLLLLFNGQIAGVSGIAGDLVSPAKGEIKWRAAFTLGLLLGGLALGFARPELFEIHVTRSMAAVAVAGLLVGFGTRLGRGCTSGHGVCGLSRLSPRSFVSVATFMTTGAIMVFVVRTFFGNAL